MSALTDLFTAMANKIRSKTGTATTYTPLEMVSDGIDDVYDAGYAAGGGGVSPTSITPSDSSPASMTAGNAYEPTANGYAIASNPTSITPSTNMPSLTAGTIYKPTGNGYAISTYTPLTPSDSSPVPLSAQTIYRVTNGSNGGYAIESSPTSVTPSSSGTYFASGIAKMLTSGYAYDSQPADCKTGSVTTSTSTTTYVNLGFEPKYIAVIAWVSHTKFLANIYNSDVASGYQIRARMDSSDSSTAVAPPMPYTGTGTNYITSIDSTGFTLSKANSAYGTTAYYFAIG